MGHELAYRCSTGAVIGKFPLNPSFFRCYFHHCPQWVLPPLKINTQIERRIRFMHVIGPMSFVLFVEIKGVSSGVPTICPHFWVEGASVPQPLMSFHGPLIKFKELISPIICFRVKFPHFSCVLSCLPLILRHFVVRYHREALSARGEWASKAPDSHNFSSCSGEITLACKQKLASCHTYFSKSGNFYMHILASSQAGTW